MTGDESRLALTVLGVTCALVSAALFWTGHVEPGIGFAVLATPLLLDVAVRTLDRRRRSRR